MAKFINITGQRFGRLVAIIRCESGQWLCQCDCGNETRVASGNLRYGTTKSCGCLAREMLLKRNTKHGLRHTPEWHIWAQMIGRCTNPRNKGYGNYGGRGIKIEDPRWFDFRNFYIDIGPRPSPELTLERINNDFGYCKDNVSWRSRKEQSRNRRGRHYVTYRGETKMLQEWAEITGIKINVLIMRARHGWSDEKIISTPLVRIVK